MAVAEAIIGATAARELVSTDLAIAATEQIRRRCSGRHCRRCAIAATERVVQVKASTAQQSLLLREDIVVFIVQDGVVAYHAFRRLSRGRTSISLAHAAVEPNAAIDSNKTNVVSDKPVLPGM